MRAITKGMLLAVCVLMGTAASAQTVDELVEKSLAATGGREAISKLTSRSTTGTMTVSTPMGDLSGTIESLNQAPNKVRTLITLDLTAMGAGMMTIDQRFDGANAFAMDSMRGVTPMTQSQIESLRNTIFPSAFLDYKERGTKIELAGKEKAGDRDVYALIVTPKSGPVTRLSLDATTYLPVKSVATVESAEVGAVEQTTELSDFRDVDGVKTAFKIKGSSAVQTFTIVVTKVEHNVKVDPALFVKPSDK